MKKQKEFFEIEEKQKTLINIMSTFQQKIISFLFMLKFLYKSTNYTNEKIMEEIRNINNSSNHYFPIQQIHSYDSNISRLVNGKIQYKSPVKSIKGKINQLMIKVTLSKNFDSKQFKIISSIPANQWLKNQLDLVLKICEDKKIFDEFFTLFYKNHLTISNWCQLATKQRSQIQPYVFKQLLKHKISEFAVRQSFNNERLKNSISILKKKSIDKKYITNSRITNKERQKSLLPQQQCQQLNDSNINGGQSENGSFMKPTFTPLGMGRYSLKNRQNEKSQILSQNKQQLMNVFFNNSIEVDKKQRKRKPLNLQRFKNTKKQPHDHHDLYMKTFDACNGWNYIFYDYEKHMKGFGQKKRYNKFVRNISGQANASGFFQAKDRTSMIENESSSKKMQKYMEFEEFKASHIIKQKCSLLPINIVLNEKQLNNYQGLKKVVSSNKSSKIVFVNHQGKPITYYIRSQQTKGKYRFGQSQSKKMLRQSTCNNQEKSQILNIQNSTTFR